MLRQFLFDELSMVIRENKKLTCKSYFICRLTIKYEFSSYPFSHPGATRHLTEGYGIYPKIELPRFFIHHTNR